MAWKGIDFIPSSADLGDGDPTGVSIALDPTGAQSVLPAEALRTTFARYLDDVRKRSQPGALYAYTPYEIRNVLSYVHLGQPQAADELLGGCCMTGARSSGRCWPRSCIHGCASRATWATCRIPGSAPNTAARCSAC